MSNALAIAAVTAGLQSLLGRALTEAKKSGIVSQAAKVTAQPPDRLAGDQQGEARLNLFLYEVTPNSGWANENLPSRNADGDRTSSPRLALDLNYLLSAHGVDDLEAEIVLGHALQMFHETPGLSRAALRTLLDPSPADGPGILPHVFRQQAVQLADQLEWIKLTPRHWKSDELSKVWSCLQTAYRPSVAYQATVVLIERRQSVVSAPPVLTRGADDRGPRALVSGLPPFPTLLGIRLPDRQPAVGVQGRIKLFGHHLVGSGVRVIFRKSLQTQPLTAEGDAVKTGRPDWSSEELPPHDVLLVADQRIEVDLAQVQPADQWSAGEYSVTVELLPAGEQTVRATNSLAVAIAPAFATSGPQRPQVVVGPGNAVAITLTCTPPLQPGQRASLIVGNQELPGPAITAATATPTFVGRLPDAMLVPGSQHLARLRVDGVESLYIRRFTPPQPPEFDPAQAIVMP